MFLLFYDFYLRVYSEKAKTPKSPKGDFEEFIDFHQIPH